MISYYFCFGQMNHFQLPVVVFSISLVFNNDAREPIKLSLVHFPLIITLAHAKLFLDFGNKRSQNFDSRLLFTSSFYYLDRSVVIFTRSSEYCTLYHLPNKWILFG